MKKHLKLLVLVLSLALIIGAVAIVASADNGNVAKIGDVEYETFEAALDAVKAGDEIVLLADATQYNQKGVSVNFTINLNGKTLTHTNGGDAMFGINGNSNFTVKGPGKIVVVGFLVYQGDATKNPNVTFEGPDLVIDYQPAQNKNLLSIKGGEYNFKNVDINIGYYAGANHAFNFNTDATGKMKFDNVKINADKEDNLTDAIFYFRANGSVELRNSYVHSSGAFSRFEKSTSTAPLYIYNSVLEQKYSDYIPLGEAGANRKTCYFLYWNDAINGGDIVVENSFVEICYRLNCGVGKDIKFINSTLRHSGYSEIETSDDTILVRYTNLKFDGNSDRKSVV